MSIDALEKQEQMLKLRKKVLQAEQERLGNAPTLDIARAREQLKIKRTNYKPIEVKNMQRHKQGIYEKYIKRIFDIILSLTALILLSPVLLIVAVLVRIKLGAPIIFHQQRPGYHEKIFGLCKFRSMTDARDQNGELLPDEVRLTKFGKALRATSLDELPELWNILKGDMSLIGPRPLLVKYLPLYNDFQKQRHDVRPGLTGWAQVNGRNAISWEQRFAYDVEYVKNISFKMDLKILFQTVAVVFRHSDINSATDATMEAFTGTKTQTNMEDRP